MRQWSPIKKSPIPLPNTSPSTVYGYTVNIIWSQPMSTAVEAQITFGDLIPYLTYGWEGEVGGG